MASSPTTESGPAFDLETRAYMRKTFPVLPDPSTGIPFHMQGAPLPDPLQTHTVHPDVKQATHNLVSNSLPFHHFVGTFHAQINQPQFLGVNEKIYWA